MAAEIDAMNAAFENLKTEASEALAKYSDISKKLDDLINNPPQTNPEFKDAVVTIAAEMNDLAAKLDVDFGTQAPVPAPEPEPFPEPEGNS